MQLDNLLSEMALSNAHTELYFKFLRKKFIVSMYIAQSSNNGPSKTISNPFLNKLQFAKTKLLYIFNGRVIDNVK